jgi:hypothetical protein
LFFLAASTAHAQTRGTVEVIKDPRIDTLLARRLEHGRGNVNATGGNTATPSAGSSYISTSGYRVQIFSGSSRAAAYNTQERLRQKFPDVRTYITYREPDFRVRAGDFRTRLEATKFMQDVRNMFSGLFVISEKINPLVQ